MDVYPSQADVVKLSPGEYGGQNVHILFDSIMLTINVMEIMKGDC